MLAAVVAFLLYVTFAAEHQVDVVSAQGAPELTVDVTARSGSGRSAIPRYGITRARAATVGHQPLVVPVNEAIRFDLTSRRRDPRILGPAAALQARR